MWTLAIILVILSEFFLSRQNYTLQVLGQNDETFWTKPKRFEIFQIII